MENISNFIEQISILLLIFVGVGFWFVNRIFKKKMINQSMNYQLMTVRVPRDISQDKNENVKKIAEMIANCDQMISNLNKFKYSIVFEVASPIDSREIMFYVACHRKHIEMIQKMITAYFPFGEVLETKDYTIFGLNNHHGGAIGKLNTNFALPIKTYQNFESDSFSSILNAFSKIEEKEGMAMQLILNSTSTEKKEIKKILEALKDGKKEKDLFKKKFIDFSGVSESLNPFRKSDEKDKKEEPKVIDEVLIKSVESKIAQPLFNVNVRVLVSSPDKHRIDSLIQEVQNGFMQLSSPVLNLIELKKQKGRALQDLMFQYVYRLFDIKNRLVLNSSEINSFWHLPHALMEVPNVKWLRSRTAPVPANLPEEGIVLGKNIYRGDEKLVRQKMKDRRLHTYVVGQTGTGKTTFLKNMVIQDIKDGKGVCFIDPHGDLANEILDYIPEERIKDVVYFNPSDPKYTMSFNILETSPDKQMDQTFIIDEVLEIMDKLYDLKTTGGPIFEQYMRNSLALLMSDPVEQFTLVEVPSVLINDKFRKRLLARTTNFLVKDFWEREAEKAGGDLSLSNMAPYINSKLTPFLTNNIMRPIIGQRNSSIDFEDILNNQKIFIVNLAKGLLGETNSYLIGMILVGKLAVSAFARAGMPEEERKDFYLYVDEFQNITTKTIPQILAEARKYRLSLIIAHQYVAQVKEDIRDAIFGNVGSMVSFRVSNEDGEKLKKYFSPVFNETDLVSLANYNAYVRLMIDGEPSRAFNIVTLKPEVVGISYKPEVIESSNNLYGRLRLEVDAEIMERFQNNNKEIDQKEIVDEKKVDASEEKEDDEEFDEEFLNEILASMREEEKNQNKEEKDKENNKE